MSIGICSCFSGSAISATLKNTALLLKKCPKCVNLCKTIDYKCQNKVLYVTKKTVSRKRIERQKLRSIAVSIHMQSKIVLSFYLLLSVWAVFVSFFLRRRIVGKRFCRNSTEPWCYWLFNMWTDVLITRRSCGSNPISATNYRWFRKKSAVFLLSGFCKTRG